MAILVIEFHGFSTGGSSFFMKEVAIVDITSNDEKQFLARPPFPYDQLNHSLRYTADYTRRYVHGLPWKGGYVDSNDVELAVIKAVENATLVYTKGLEKVKFLLELTRCPATKVVDLDEFPGISKTSQKRPFFRCLYEHPEHNKLKCALEQAVRYRDYMRENYYFRF